MAEKQEEVTKAAMENPMSKRYIFCEDKELLAYLGHALYECQRLEVTIAYIIQDLHLLTGGLKGDGLLERLKKFQRILDSRLKKTLGGLLKEIREFEKLDDESEHLLYEALHKRNEIVHQFFYKHWIAMVTPVGRDVMLDDLRKSVQIISDARRLSERIRNQLDDQIKLDAESANDIC